MIGNANTRTSVISMRIAQPLLDQIEEGAANASTLLWFAILLGGIGPRINPIVLQTTKQ
jgi:hypothetical protein